MNTNNVSTGKPAVGGAIFVAPAGTALPTSASASLGNTFKELGYASEDGLVNNRSFDVEDIKAWGGDVVASVENNNKDTFGFTLIEVMSLDVLKTVYNDANVTGTALSSGLTVKVNSKEHEEKAWVFDMILKGGILKRITLPKAAITEIGEITYKDNEAVGYAVTLTAYPDANGNTHYEYLQTATTPTPGTPT